MKLLNGGNFSDAISLLLECQQVALAYKHFQCIAALSGKLQDTLVIAEEQLDVALAKVRNFVCFVLKYPNFNEVHVADLL